MKARQLFDPKYDFIRTQWYHIFINIISSKNNSLIFIIFLIVNQNMSPYDVHIFGALSVNDSIDDQIDDSIDGFHWWIPFMIPLMIPLMDSIDNSIDGF